MRKREGSGKVDVPPAQERGTVIYKYTNKRYPVDAEVWCAQERGLISTQSQSTS
jgi:hypothetical protein